MGGGVVFEQSSDAVGGDSEETDTNTNENNESGNEGDVGDSSTGNQEGDVDNTGVFSASGEGSGTDGVNPASSELVGALGSGVISLGETGEDGDLSLLDTGGWTVTYYNSDDSEFYVESVVNGETPDGPSGDPTDPDGTGAFIGWYKEGEIAPVDLSTLIITGNLNLYAKFSNTEGVVRFRDMQYNILNAYTVSAATVGEVTGKPTATEAGVPSGKSITHWYDETGSDSVDFFADGSTTVSGVVTLLPKVTGMYTVSFNANGGTAVNPLSGLEGEPAPKPADGATTKPGMELLYWSAIAGNDGDSGVEDYYTSGAGGTVPLLTGNITLYAVWGNAQKAGYVLVYYTSDYSVYKQPEDRTSYTQRTSVTVTANEDKQPVGSTLTPEEIKAVAEKYKPDAIAQNVMFKYYTYYENVEQNRPLQSGAIDSFGTTTIHVYYTPYLYKIEFDLTDGGAITVDGTLQANYSIDVNYRLTMGDIWPANPGERKDDAGAIITLEGKRVVGWQTSLDGYTATFTSGLILPDILWNTSDNAIKVKPVWEDTSDTILVTTRAYEEVYYTSKQKIVAGELTAKYYGDLTFTGNYEDDFPRYIYLEEGENHPNDTVFYSTENMSASTANFTAYQSKPYKENADARYKYIYNNLDDKNAATAVNSFIFVTIGTAKLTFNPSPGAFVEGFTEATIERKSAYPILEQGYTAPDANDIVAPTGKVFAGWYMDVGFSKPLTADTMKHHTPEIAYAKYAPMTPTVTFYDSAAMTNAVGTVSVDYEQSLNDAGKSLPSSPAVGSIVDGLGKMTGWFYELNGQEYRFTLDTPLNQETYAVYAQYESVSYTVTFHDESGDPTGETRTVWSDPTGSGKNTIAQGGGMNRKLPALTSRAGHIAMWTTQLNGEGSPFSATTQVSGNMNVYAFYDPLVTINYETLTGGTGLTRTTETIPAKHGTALGANITAMTGYELDGWYKGTDTTPAGTSLTFTPSKVGGVYEAATYTARFLAVINYQSLSTAIGEVSRDQEKPIADDDANVLGSTATATGSNATFVMWVDSQGKEVPDTYVSGTNGETIRPPAKPDTYTAIFKDPNYTTLAYEVVPLENSDPNAVKIYGGTVSPAAEYLLIGDDSASGSTAAAYEGFEFDYWSKTPYGQSIGDDELYVPVKPGAQWPADTVTTFYAHFKEAGNITINYMVGTGRGTLDPYNESLTPLTGTATGSMPAALPGYTFDKWTTDAAGTNQALTTGADDIFVPEKETVNNNEVYVARTYYAHFTENEVAINYEVGDAGGGSVSNGTDTVLAETGDDTFLAGSTPTANTGYTFIGWAMNADGTDSVDASWVDTDDKIMPQKEDSGNVNPAYDIYKPATYYAIFEANEVTVIYDVDGDTAVVPNETVDYGSTIGTSPTPPAANIPEGYTFGGWRAAGANSNWVFGASGTGTAVTAQNGVVNADTDAPTLTLIARWTPKTITITYNLNYAGAPAYTPPNAEARTGTYDQLLVAPTPNPTRIGYTFSAWYKEAEGTTAWNYATEKVKTETGFTLYAQWTPVYYSLNFDVNGGGSTAPGGQSLKYGDLADPVNDPTRADHTFLSWNTAADGTGITWNFASTTMPANHVTLYAQWQYSGGGGGGGGDDGDDDDPPPPIIDDPEDPVPPIVEPPEPEPPTPVIPEIEPGTTTEVIADGSTPSGFEIGEDGVPLFGGAGAVWALLNFILMLVGGIFAVVLLLRTGFSSRKDDEDVEYYEAGTGDEEEQKKRVRPLWTIVSVILGAVGVIVFLLTEDLSNMMVWMDQWTVLMVLILAAELVAFRLSFRKTQETLREQNV